MASDAEEMRRLLSKLQRDTDEMILAFDQQRDNTDALKVFFVPLVNMLIKVGLIDRDAIITSAMDAAKEMRGTNAFEVLSQVEIIAQKLAAAPPRPQRSLFGKMRSFFASKR